MKNKDYGMKGSIMIFHGKSRRELNFSGASNVYPEMR
jgi:hypothetical protein